MNITLLRIIKWKNNISIKQYVVAREMAQQFPGLADPPKEDLGLIIKSHMAAHNCL